MSLDLLREIVRQDKVVLERGAVAKLAGWIVLASSVELLGILMLGQYADFIFSKDGVAFLEWIPFNQALVDNIDIVVACLCALIIISAGLVSMWCSWSIALYSQQLSVTLGNHVYSTLLGSGWSRTSRFSHADKLNILINEVERVANLIVLPALNILSRSFLILILLIGASLESLISTFLIGVLVLIAYGGFFIFIRRTIYKFGFIVTEANRLRLDYANSGIRLFKEIFAFKAQHYFIERYSFAGRILAKTQAKMMAMAQLPRYVVETSVFLGFCAFLYYVGNRGLDDGSLDVGMITVFMAGGLKAMVAIQQCYAAAVEIKANAASWSQIAEVLKEGDEDLPLRSFTTSAPQCDFRSLTLERVNLVVDNNINVLNEISCSIYERGMFAIVGPSGAGKSSLANVILGLIENAEGTISINGGTLNFAQYNSIQKASPLVRFGYVGQELFLEQKSLAENVAFGIAPELLDIDRVRLSLVEAGLNDVINSWSDADLVSTVPSYFSIGQVQRVAIARALYANVQILLLDEPTSALDTQNTQKFLDFLVSIKNRLTVVMITHKIDCLKIFDEILYLDKGSLVANGTYMKLLTDCSEFADFVSTDH